MARRSRATSMAICKMDRKEAKDSSDSCVQIAHGFFEQPQQLAPNLFQRIGRRRRLRRAHEANRAIAVPNRRDVCASKDRLANGTSDGADGRSPERWGKAGQCSRRKTWPISMRLGMRLFEAASSENQDEFDWPAKGPWKKIAK
jgi:hypothetical protein